MFNLLSISLITSILLGLFKYTLLVKYVLSFYLFSILANRAKWYTLCDFHPGENQ